MNPEQKHFQDLLQRYADHRISKQDYDLLMDYIRENGIDPDLENVMDKDWESLESNFPFSSAQLTGIYNRIIADPRFNTVKTEQPVKKLRQFSWKAVAAVLLVPCIFYLYMHKYATNHAAGKTAQTQIVPGKNTATLILANGHKIKLDSIGNGRLAEQTGVTITKTKGGKLVYTVSNTVVAGQIKYNTLTTARGQQYQIVLPDGTKVWINAASSITYPVTFASLSQRKVELHGEAYFEVFKDKLHPFIVKTDKQELQVLGTHFNVNSYADEPFTKTTLLEGAVSVWPVAQNLSGPPSFANTILKPGEQLTIANIGKMQVDQVDTADAVAWKNGQFLFDNDNLETIMHRIARWYDIEVDYTKQEAKSEVFSGKISRSENITEVLKLLNLTKAVNFKVEGRKVIVMK